MKRASSVDSSSDLEERERLRSRKVRENQILSISG